MGGDRLANSNERAAGFLMARIYGFTPVSDANSRVLILGSMPSVKSRDDGLYYGHELNDFAAFFAAHPSVRAVLVNGGLAAQKFKPALAEGRPIVRLPSTSPAYTLPYDKKRAAWRSALMRFLED